MLLPMVLRRAASVDFQRLILLLVDLNAFKNLQTELSHIVQIYLHQMDP